ncbi:hypothetical protein O1611_g970 [Lasiodiplodia mahajangana]|uniref:Uncharacterized protein n=1 Tax=Lasiodiplodia mahajangana TaxID=1108764 RepID=A0ACC2JZ26_9PEZI|nr:hypothetical protein O1611_g970 [Lasiodiplodia mahajangana]
MISLRTSSAQDLLGVIEISRGDQLGKCFLSLPLTGSGDTAMLVRQGSANSGSRTAGFVSNPTFPFIVPSIFLETNDETAPLACASTSHLSSFLAHVPSVALEQPWHATAQFPHAGVSLLPKSLSSPSVAAAAKTVPRNELARA